MSGESEAVHEAIDRWLSAGLVDAETANRLRIEVDEVASVRTRRLSQYVLAVTGGVVLLIAGGLFVDWAWPLLPRSARALLLGAIGFAVVALGVRTETSWRWLPASYLLQTSGLGLLLAAFIYSEGVWSDVTGGGFVVGTLSLVVPLVLAPRAMRRNTVMPAVHLATGLGFLAVFLDRATTLSGDGTPVRGRCRRVGLRIRQAPRAARSHGHVRPGVHHAPLVLGGRPRRGAGGGRRVGRDCWPAVLGIRTYRIGDPRRVGGHTGGE